MPKINQLAICCTDFYQSAHFFEHVMGLESVFGTIAFRGEAAEAIQGLPNPASKVRWFLDGTDWFQLELFQFENPEPAPLPDNYSIQTEGYSHLIFAVHSLDRVCHDMIESGFLQSIDIVETKQRRYGKTTGPDGVILELVEDPRLVPTERKSRLLGCGLTTPEHDATVSIMVDTYGFEKVDDFLEREQVWGESGSLKLATTLQNGDKFLIVSEYDDVLVRPKNYRLCDVGIMNISLGYESIELFLDAVTATKDSGCTHNCEPQRVGDTMAGTYSTTPQGYSVEMNFSERSQFGLWGWSDPSQRDREINYKRSIGAIRRYVPD
jgi:catechol 2,3-dioxygenase-like lactoylglutathione lyase family enzyme